MIEIDFTNLLLTHDKILIIGLPQAGKTTLFEKFREHTYGKIFLLQTDDFKEEPWIQQLTSIMDKLRDQKKWLVEGVQGYRLLRKYIQKQDYKLKPDLIIIVFSSEETLKKHKGMVKTLTKIWNDYLGLEEDLPIVLNYRRTEYY